MKRALLVGLLALGACRPAPAPRRPSDVTVGPAKGGTGIAGTPCTTDEAAEPASEEEAFGRKVAVICIDGVRPDARKAIETALGFEVGAVLTEKALRDGLVAIHRTNIVDDASVYASKLGTGVVLVFHFHERPRVGKVALEGNSAVNITVEQAPERTALHPGEHFDPMYALDRANALRDAYQSAGYEEATVTPQTKPAGDGIIDVRMVIHEGTRSRIGTIATKGITPSLEAGVLKASGLVRGEPVSPDVLSVAPMRITDFYYETGNISANVKVDRGTRAADGNVPIVVDVTEGPVFRVGKLKLDKSGLDAANTQRILASLQTKSGAIFRRAPLVADINAVKHSYSDRGRVVEVQPITEVDQDKHTVDVTLEITSP